MPRSRWISFKCTGLPFRAIARVLRGCGLAPAFTDTDAGYELFRKAL